jgi:hypothetical protein
VSGSCSPELHILASSPQLPLPPYPYCYCMCRHLHHNYAPQFRQLAESTLRCWKKAADEAAAKAAAAAAADAADGNGCAGPSFIRRGRKSMLLDKCMRAIDDAIMAQASMAASARNYLRNACARMHVALTPACKP